nr:hypothetical protein [Tanacetum cinerariifolium]
MSTLVFVDPVISTQADGAQSSRVPVPLPADPYVVIRQAYLVEADTESEPFEELVKTETPESPHTVASPTSLPDSTLPTCHVEESKDSDTTARMAVRVPPVMLLGLSDSIAEVATMFDSAFRKRFRSSYDSSPSSSSPDLPLWKRYWGTSELVEDDDDDEDDEEEDEDMEGSLDFDSESEGAEDKGPTTEDEDPVAREEGLAARDEGPDIRVESLGLGGDEAVPEGQQRAASVVETTVDEPLGFGYEALRHQEIALREGRMPSVFEEGQISGSVPVPERPKRVSTLRQPTLTTWIDPEDASPSMAETEGFLSELGAQVEMQGGLIHDHTVRLGELSPALFERYDRDIGELFTRSGAVRDEIFSQRYQFRSLDHE